MSVVFPSTFRQAWYFRSTRSGWSALNVPVVLRVSGGCDPSALQLAIDDLVGRHEALRTSLARERDKVVQQVSTSGQVELEAAQVGWGAEDVNAVGRLAPDVDRAFNLDGGPLVRARLYELAPKAHLVLLVAHHAVCDGWSAGVLARDLMELYCARREGRAPSLPHIEYQLGDYAAWRAEQGVGDAAYWAERLSGGHGRLTLASTEAEAAPGAFESFRLPEFSREDVEGLRGVARAHRTTMPRVLGAATIASLREGLGDGVTVGVWLSNRSVPGLRDVVGDLAELVPVRVDLSGSPSFAELVDRYHVAAADAHDRAAPMWWLSRLIRANPERASGPLVDVSLNYDPQRVAGTEGRRRCGESVIEQIAFPLEARTFRVTDWWDGLSLLDYQLRPELDGGYVVANVQAISRDAVEDVIGRLCAVIPRVARGGADELAALGRMRA